jgi:uncharacterized protein with von Willebrand factor type A (vWA) domain
MIPPNPHPVTPVTPAPPTPPVDSTDVDADAAAIVPLKRDVADFKDPRALTMLRGSFSKSAWKRSLGTKELPTDLSRAVDAQAGKLSEWAPFVSELHSSLYDPSGNKALEEVERDPVGIELLGSAEAQAAWAEIRMAARCHPAVAAQVTAEVANIVAEVTGIAAMKEDEEAKESPEKLQQEHEAISEMETDPNDPNGAKDKQEALDQIRAAMQKARARRSALEQKLNKARSDGSLGRAMQRAAGNASAAADAANALMDMGYSKEGADTSPKKLTPELVKLVSSSPDFKRIVDMIGRMQQATDIRAAEAESLGRMAPDGITVAKEIGDVIASEWALEDVDEDLWDMRFMDRQALGVERISPEPKHKGDLVVLVDKSGSMGGQRIEWARAMALAAIQRATKDGRRWVLAMYSGTGDIKVSTSERSFEHAMRTMSVDAGGGTDTNWAMHHVLTQTDLRGLKDPDILLVTDGDWEPLHEDTLGEMNKLKMRLFIVQLEGHSEPKGATRVWHLQRLDIEHAAEILADTTI